MSNYLRNKLPLLQYVPHCTKNGVGILTAVLQGNWDQEKFERLLTEWIIACDQPFDEVDKPELRSLLTYVHHPSSTLKIPHRDGIKRRAMKMGADVVDGVKQMFAVGVFWVTLWMY